MSVSMYFSPSGQAEKKFKEGTLGTFIQHHNEKSGFPDIDDIDIAFLGVSEDRMSERNSGCADAPDSVRSYLFDLFPGPYKTKIADLGNIIRGETIDDTYFALSQVLEELLKKKVFPFIIGGSHDLTYASYLAYENLEQVVNLVTIDKSFDMGKADDPISSDTFLSKIILRQPNYLFNYSNIGYQTYFVEQKELDLMSKLFFDAYRLGDIRTDLTKTEPIIRNADIISVDIASVRQSDASATSETTPNGFNGEEVCQMFRYAGLSDKLTSMGLYEINPSFDDRGQTAHLAAQMVWCFLDGFYNRKRDFPLATKKDFLKYRVSFKNGTDEIIFYKSLKSERWWMDVPYPPNKGMRYSRHHYVPCTYDDYQTACNEDIPDKWWKTYQKLS